MMGHKLLVHMIQAHGLNPYCVCEVKHADAHGNTTKAETQPVTSGDILNPVWDETFEIGPWHEGESLEFTIYDKGLTGAKTEGKVLLPTESFFPNGFNETLNISDLPGAFLQVEVQILDSTAGETTNGSAASTDIMPPQQSVEHMDPQRLGISILEVHGLQHLNHFTGDHPYVTCEIKHIDKARSTQIETKPVMEDNMQNPFWGETHYLDSWNPGEPLEFSIYDQGLMGSKTEAKAVLPAQLFSPQGFTGMIPISGLQKAVLHIIVRPLGPWSKKLKRNNKSKGCC